MITISAATDTIDVYPDYGRITITRSMAGADGRQWVWRLDAATARLISDALADCCEVLEGNESDDIE